MKALSMKFALIFIISISFIIFSCRVNSQNLNYTNSDKIALDLIQLCVDATLQLDPGLNTGEIYKIDFSLVQQLSKKGVAHFLSLHPYATEANVDSLFKSDSTWVQYQFFQHPAIRFEKIETQKDGTILINTSKHKASDGSIGTKIILKNVGDKFICLSKEITWIS